MQRRAKRGSETFQVEQQYRPTQLEEILEFYSVHVHGEDARQPRNAKNHDTVHLHDIPYFFHSEIPLSTFKKYTHKNSQHISNIPLQSPLRHHCHVMTRISYDLPLEPLWRFLMESDDLDAHTVIEDSVDHC